MALALTAAALAAGFACAPSTAASVGDVPISRAALEKELAAIVGNREYVRFYEQDAGIKAVDKEGRPTRLFTAVTLTNDITFLGVRHIAKERRVRVTAEDKRKGRTDASGILGGAHIFRLFPAWYRGNLERRTALSIALKRSFLIDTSEREFYNRFGDRYRRACTRDILLKSKQDAEAARRRILAGESFESVARDVSIDRGTGPRGGFLSCNPRGDLVPELDNAAFTLALGEVSEPIRTENGYHLFKVDSREKPPLEKIRGEIRDAIDKAVTQEMRSRLKLRLGQLGVKVDGSYGTWHGEQLVVVAV